MNPHQDGDMQYGYARNSPLDPNPAAQLRALRKAGCDKIFTEKWSAGATDRPELKICLEELKTGDTLTVCKLDRLGSLRDLVKIGEHFQERGIEFRSLGEEINTAAPGGNLAFQYFAAAAELERSVAAERMNLSRDMAIARGAQLGAPHKMTPEKIKLAKELIARGEKKKRIKEMFGISYPTLSRALAAPQPQ